MKISIPNNPDLFALMAKAVAASQQLAVTEVTLRDKHHTVTVNSTFITIQDAEPASVSMSPAEREEERQQTITQLVSELDSSGFKPADIYIEDKRVQRLIEGSA